MIIEIVKGMSFTLRQMFKKPITMQWPEEQKPAPTRHRGKHILHRYDNGLEKCIGCELCAAACPVGCIYVGSAENDPQNPVSPGERYAERYEINLMRCIYCGYCAEACPTEAITLGPQYDLADYRRERLVVTKEDLLEAWPGASSNKKEVRNLLGAGADQRTKPKKEIGPNPRAAWEKKQEEQGDDQTPISPGHGGISRHVPTVKEPQE